MSAAELDPKWWRRARCRGEDPEIFFEGEAGDSKAARALCTPCPVAAECRLEAVREDDRYAMRGGVSASQRTRAKTRMGAGR